MSVRTDLAASLTTSLKTIRARHYDVRAEADLPDTIRKSTVIVRGPNYDQAPNAQGNMLASFIVTVATHFIDIDKAETELDQAVPDVMQALEQFGSLTFTTARQVIVKETWRGYDITCSTPIAKPF